MLSIITPCYNSSKDISRLIKSLQNQNDKNFEWIVVDDCSKNEDYAQLKKIVEDSCVIHKLLRNENNIGAGQSRNRALQESSGSHVVFVDSDDYVTEDFVLEIMQKCQKTNCDVFVFDYYKTTKNDDFVKNTIPLFDSGYISVKNTLLNMSTSVCGKCYKKSIIDTHHIVFPTLKRFEDWAFNTLCILKSETILYNKKPLYHYVSNPESITHRFKTNVYQYSLNAFHYLKKALMEYDYDVCEFLFIREIIYVAAVNETLGLGSAKLNEVLSNLTKEFPKWKKNRYLHLLSKPQKMVLFFVKRNMLVSLKLFLKLVRRG